MLRNIFKRSEIEKEYSKNDRKTLDEFTETLLSDIDTYIINIDRTIENIDRAVNKLGGYDRLQEFMVNKLEQHISTLKESKSDLLKIKRHNKIKLRYLYETYKLFSTVNSCINSLRDMQYRLKEYVRED